MEARKIKLLEFIGNGKKTFNIPVYQRNYDWQEENCKKLFTDIENIINNFDNVTLKGEFVIVVEGNKNEIDYSDLDLVEHVDMYISDGLDKMEAIKQTSKDLKLSKSEVYKK